MNVHIFFVGVSVRVFAFCPAKKIPRNPLSVSNVRIYICDGALLKNLPLTWERYIYVQKKVIRKAYYLADCCLLYVKYLYLRTGLWSPPRIDFTAFRSDTRPKFFCMMIFLYILIKTFFNIKITFSVWNIIIFFLMIHLYMICRANRSIWIILNTIWFINSYDSRHNKSIVLLISITT